MSPLWAWLVPAIRTALAKVSPETQRDWGTCFATSSDSRDPNRLHWLMEVAMEEPIRCQGSFIDASRLYMLQGVVAQQRWRVGQLLRRLLAFLLPFLHHPYSNVRSRLGAVLTNIFALDINFPGWGNASVTSPDVSSCSSCSSCFFSCSSYSPCSFFCSFSCSHCSSRRESSCYP